LSDDWIILSNDRKMQRFKDFICIVPKDYNPGTPFDCPQCGVLFSDSDDLKAYHNYRCCKECSYDGTQASNRTKK